jgi:hypothetical protein
MVYKSRLRGNLCVRQLVASQVASRLLVSHQCARRGYSPTGIFRSAVMLVPPGYSGDTRPWPIYRTIELDERRTGFIPFSITNSERINCLYSTYTLDAFSPSSDSSSEPSSLSTKSHGTVSSRSPCGP